MLNALTFDVEDYFQVSAFEGIIRYEDWDKLESRVVFNTEKILGILSGYKVKATFFILGWVAERFPEIVKEIDREGHEVASHGYGHKLIYNQTRAEFRNDLKKSVNILEEIIGKRVTGYRACSYSIVKETLWALDTLREEGLKYDSSIFPIIHDRYGMPDAPRFPHVVVEGGRGDKSLIEFPLSTVKLMGRNFPIAGGGYLRLFPYSLIKWGIRRINREGHPAIIYLHPWEFDPERPRQSVPLLTRFRHYVNLRKTEKKLRALLEDFNFAPVREVLGISRG